MNHGGSHKAKGRWIKYPRKCPDCEELISNDNLARHRRRYCTKKKIKILSTPICSKKKKYREDSKTTTASKRDVDDFPIEPKLVKEIKITPFTLPKDEKKKNIKEEMNDFEIWARKDPDEELLTNPTFVKELIHDARKTTTELKEAYREIKKLKEEKEEDGQNENTKKRLQKRDIEVVKLKQTIKRREDEICLLKRRNYELEVKCKGHSKVNMKKTHWL